MLSLIFPVCEHSPSLYDSFMSLLLAVKKKKILPFVTAWMDLENIILSCLLYTSDAADDYFWV